MPSTIELRKKLGLRSRKDQALSGAPAATQPPAPASSTTGTTTSLDSTLSAPPLQPPKDDAFGIAVQEHLQKLTESERKAFNIAYQGLDPMAILSQVKGFDDSHNQKSTSRRCLSTVEKFLQVLEQFMQAVAIGINQNPEISSLVVGAVRLVIDLAIKFVTFFNKLSSMFSQISDHLEHLVVYSKAARGNQLIQKTTADVYGDLLEFCRQARLVFVEKNGGLKTLTSIRIFIRVQWEPFESRFGSINSSLEHHLTVLQHAAHAVLLDETGIERHRAQQAHREKERKDCLHWLSALDFDRDHDNLYKERYPRTGDWLLQRKEFTEWFRSPDSSLLWCFGHPGAGKSVLASCVLEHITARHGLDENVGIAFAYYKHDSLAVDRSSSAVIASLVKQLCWKKSIVPSHLLDFYHHYDRDARRPTLDKYTDSFRKLADSFSEVYLVIDGLDECEEVQRSDILSLVTTLVNDLAAAKVFVSSRREVDIEQAFQKHNIPTIQIEAKTVNVDIDVYVRGQVDTRLRDGKLRIQDPTLQGRIIDTLVGRAGGMFLWVKLQLENLCRQRTDRDILAELESLPVDLDETYRRIEDQIHQHSPRRRDLAQRSLTWVFFAARPLDEDELIHAVAVEPNSQSREDLNLYRISDIVEACANLLTLEDAVVRPIHFSVREYFTSHSNNIGSPYAGLLLHFEDAHEYLAISCLSYLMLGFLDGGTCAGVFELSDRMDDHPLCNYAACFFDIHSQHVREARVDLQAALERFLSLPSPSLASVLQLRQVGNDCGYSSVRANFDPVAWEVNAGAMIYSTALYKMADSHLCTYLKKNGGLSNLMVPTFTLHHACGAGLLDCVVRLVQSGHGIHEADASGASPLYHAAKNGHIDVCDFLLQELIDVNMLGGYYGTALQAAAVGGHQAIVPMLLDRGADINAQGGEFGNALYAAAAEGHGDIVLSLLDRGADINAKGGKYGNALHAAVAEGHGDIVLTLLDRGANVNAQGGHYGNALCAAVASDGDSREVVQLLLDRGADIDAQGGDDGNALYAAALRGSREVVQLLLDRGADIDAQGGDDGNALYAAALTGSREVVQLLLDRGADINAQGGYYSNALCAAAAAASDGDNREVVQLLLDRGADINVQGGHYGNALCTAAASYDDYYGRPEVVQLLLDRGAHINVQGGHYGNALSTAAYWGGGEVVQLLLDRDADINVQGGPYGNALCAAAASYRERPEVVQLLLDRGADIKALNKEGKDALQVAHERENVEVEQLIRDKILSQGQSQSQSQVQKS